MPMGVPSDVDIRSLCSQACQAISAPFQIMTAQKNRPAARRISRRALTAGLRRSYREVIRNQGGEIQAHEEIGHLSRHPDHVQVFAEDLGTAHDQ